MITFEYPAHMPYYFGDKLLCCLSDNILLKQQTLSSQIISNHISEPIKYRPWKLYIWENEWIKVNLGVDNSQIECNANVSINNNKVHLSVIVGTIGDNFIRYNMMIYNGDNINNLFLTEIIQDVYTGFDNNKFRVIFRNGKLTIINKLTYKITTLVPDHKLLRIIDNYDNQNQMIATYWVNDSIKSFLLDFSTNTCNEITVDGQSVYKCSIHNGKIAYAVIKNNDIVAMSESVFEDRQVKLSNNYKLVNNINSDTVKLEVFSN